VPPRTGATLEARRQYADASVKAKNARAAKALTQGRRVNSKHRNADASARAKNQTTYAATTASQINANRE
jgi:hypothetical protein